MVQVQPLAPLVLKPVIGMSGQQIVATLATWKTAAVVTGVVVCGLGTARLMQTRHAPPPPSSLPAATISRAAAPAVMPVTPKEPRLDISDAPSISTEHDYQSQSLAMPPVTEVPSDVVPAETAPAIEQPTPVLLAAADTDAVQFEIGRAHV